MQIFFSKIYFFLLLFGMKFYFVDKHSHSDLYSQFKLQFLFSMLYWDTRWHFCCSIVFSKCQMAGQPELFSNKFFSLVQEINLVPKGLKQTALMMKKCPA